MLPPDALSPVTVYEAPKPARRGGFGLVGRVLGIVAAGVLTLVVSIVGGVYLWAHESIAAVSAHSPDVKAAATTLDGVPPADKAAIALVIGYDRRHGEAEGTPSRSDTLMLLRADPQTDTISMLSFPRDLVVEIRCPGSVYTSKINAAYSTCGARGALDTVRNLSGLPINYLITVNFSGFKRIVNTLGGVWVDVDRRYHNDNAGVSPGYGYAKINLQPGYQRMTGGAALDFARYRHTDSDFHRIARQQLFVTAMKEQFNRGFSLTKIPKLVGAVTKNVEVGVGGGKELTARTILRYALFAYGLQGGHFFQERIEGVTGYSELRPTARTSRTPSPASRTRTSRRRRWRPRLPQAEAQDGGAEARGHDGLPSQRLRRPRRGGRGEVPPVPARLRDDRRGSGRDRNAPWDDQFHTKVYLQRRLEAGKGGGGCDGAALRRRRAGGVRRSEEVHRATREAAAELPPARPCRTARCSPWSSARPSTTGWRRLPRARRSPVRHRTCSATARPRRRSFAPRSGRSGSRSWCRRCSTGSRRPTPMSPCARTASPRITGPSGSCSGAASNTGASSRRTGPTHPSSTVGACIGTINGRGYDFYYQGPKLHMIVFRDGERSLLGRQHAAQLALQRDDDRDRQGPPAPRPTEEGKKAKAKAKEKKKQA